MAQKEVLIDFELDSEPGTHGRGKLLVNFDSKKRLVICYQKHRGGGVDTVVVSRDTTFAFVRWLINRIRNG